MAGPSLYDLEPHDPRDGVAYGRIWVDRLDRCRNGPSRGGARAHSTDRARARERTRRPAWRTWRLVARVSVLRHRIGAPTGIARYRHRLHTIPVFDGIIRSCVEPISESPRRTPRTVRPRRNNSSGGNRADGARHTRALKR